MRLKGSAITTRGAGSARATIFGLGRSFARFEEEKETGGSGGGAGGETQQQTGTQTANSGGSQERLYTAAEVAGIVQDRLNREKRKPPEPEKKTSTTKAETSSDPTWVFDLQDAIDAHTEERAVKVPLGLKKRMRAAFAAERPSDPNAWVGAWLDDVGLVKTTTSTTSTTGKAATETKTTTETPQANGKPISDKGTATVTARDVDEITNPNDLTTVDIERIHAKHGEDKGNKLITDMVMKWAAGVKFVPDRGGPRR